MRYRPILPVAAGALAAVHTVGILTAVPLLRQAEVAALLFLLVYALTARTASLRTALPAALAVVVVDAWATMPSDPADAGWQVLRPGPVDLTDGFVTGLRLTWAPLVLVLVLVIAVRSAARPGPRVLGAAVLAASLVSGYAVVRLLDVHLATGRPPGVGSPGSAGTETIAAAGLAVLAPLALAFGAIVLAAFLAGGGRWFAAGGAALLSLVALPHLEAALAAAPRYALEGGIFSFAFQSSPHLPAPGPAVVAAIELAAYLLLVVGVCGSRAARGALGAPTR